MPSGMEIMMKALMSNLPPEVIGQIGQIGQVVASFQSELVAIKANQAEIMARQERILTMLNSNQEGNSNGQGKE